MSDKFDWATKVTLFRQQRYDGEWMPENAEKAIKWLQNIVAQAPPKFRSAVKIEIDSESSYEGSHYASIEISYWRPPTAVEIAKRRAAAKAQANEARQREIDTLKALQAKYGRSP